MTAFEAAWLVVKAPLWQYMSEFQGHPVMYQDIADPLYQGGPKSDSSQHYTDDFETALAYAVFGSGVALDGDPVPMRVTVPTVREHQFEDNDPEYRHTLMIDPEYGEWGEARYVIDPNNELTGEGTPVPNDRIREVLNRWLETTRNIPEDAQTSTSMQGHSDDNIMRHIRGALARLESGAPLLNYMSYELPERAIDAEKARERGLDEAFDLMEALDDDRI